MTENSKIEKVKEILKGYRKIVLAFSGGADSTLLAHLAKEAGCDVLAITYDNQIFPSGFLEYAKRRAEEIGIRHEIIESNFLEIDEFIKNGPERCLLCRNIMYDAIKQRANELNYQIIVDGNNITDLIHDRPGILMKYEYDIQSPFIDAWMESPEIHQYLDENNISYSKSTTCLATRVKSNEKISFEKINRIDYGEEFIKELTGLEEVKLREEKNTVRIESEDVNRLLDKDTMKSIYRELKELRYDRIVLDIDLSEKSEELIEDDELQKGEMNLRLRKKLPFDIDIGETSKAIKEDVNKSEDSFINDVESLEEIGYIKLKIDDKESKIFRDGRISIENNKNKKDAKDSLVKILGLIRRTV